MNQEFEKYDRKMEHYYDTEGLLTQYPSKRPMRIMALAKIAEKVETETIYTEKQINDIIKTSISFSDIELIRREMFQYKMLNRLRDGSQYWVEQDWKENYHEYFRED